MAFLFWRPRIAGLEPRHHPVFRLRLRRPGLPGHLTETVHADLLVQRCTPRAGLGSCWPAGTPTRGSTNRSARTGSSVYACASMLTALLLGLASGAGSARAFWRVAPEPTRAAPREHGLDSRRRRGPHDGPRTAHLVNREPRCLLDRDDPPLAWPQRFSSSLR